ncbi:MAG: hypothetical protein SWN10_13915 [Pseudomonadota bacterium]|nr:hypothetical protein [Pseudomonadota bacterium]
MARVISQSLSGKFNHWFKEKLRDPNMYCALCGVAALAIIELAVFGG